MKKQLTELEIERMIINMIDEFSFTNVEQVMKQITTTHSGQFNTEIVEGLAKDYIDYLGHGVI